MEVKELLRHLPSVHELLQQPELAAVVEQDRVRARTCARRVLSSWRERILRDRVDPPSLSELADE
ncbi:MAG: L-seryl-tRNA(Sec) selenium transferase, partial [Moorellaceae bacterium]